MEVKTQKNTESTHTLRHVDGSIKTAVTKAVRGAYAGFLKANEKAVAGGRRELLRVDVVESMVRRVFEEMGDGEAGGKGMGRTRSSGRVRRESGNI